MIDRQVFVVESGEVSSSSSSTNTVTSESTSHTATPPALFNRFATAPTMPTKQQQQSGGVGSSGGGSVSGGDSIVLGVEELVHEIKENLRLKARPSHSSRSTARPSPYHIPCRSWADAAGGSATAGEKQQVQKPKKEEPQLDDPYELLQTLLKSNNLVKEAVRRLQLNYSPKQRMFYDSDEDSSRSPIIRMCQLEL